MGGGSCEEEANPPSQHSRSKKYWQPKSASQSQVRRTPAIKIIWIKGFEKRRILGPTPQLQNSSLSVVERRGEGETRSLHFREHLSLTSQHAKFANYRPSEVAPGRLTGQAEPSAPQGKEATGLSRAPVTVASPRHKPTPSARRAAGSGSPLTRRPSGFGTCGQGRRARPGPAEGASEARAATPPGIYGVAAPPPPGLGPRTASSTGVTGGRQHPAEVLSYPFPNSPTDGGSPLSAAAPRARALACSAPEVLAAQGRKCAGSARGGGDGGGRFGCRPLAARRRARRPPLQVRPRAGGAGGRGERGLSRGRGRGGEGVGS